MNTVLEITNRFRDLRDARKLHGTIKRAVALRRERLRRKDYTDLLTLPLEQRYKSVTHGLHLDKKGYRWVEKWKRDYHPRIRTWEVEPTLQKSAWMVSFPDWDRQYKGYRPPNTNRIHWPSKITVFNARRALVEVFNYDTEKVTRRVLKAPKGWVFASDSLGALIRCSRGEIHLDSRVAFSGGLKSHVSGFLENLRRAKAARAKAIGETAKGEVARLRSRLKKLERKNLTVTLDDGRKAGLCRSGILEWGRQHGVNPIAGVPAAVLLRKWGHDFRVRRAVSAAITAVA